jgi:hypothetical protein
MFAGGISAGQTIEATGIDTVLMSGGGLGCDSNRADGAGVFSR